MVEHPASRSVVCGFKSWLVLTQDLLVSTVSVPGAAGWRGEEMVVLTRIW